MKQEDAIKSISYNQHEILHNILFLHNQGRGIEVDLTYSKGNFYGTFQVENETIYIPDPRHKFDVEPQREDVIKIEPWDKVQLEDNSVKSIIFDPPFIVQSEKSAKSKEPSHAYMSKRFNYYRSVDEMLYSYYHWIKEMYRILKDDGIIIIKNQPQVKGNHHIYSNHYIWFISESLGLTLIDNFTLLAKNRELAEQNQRFSRSYDSYFLVFKKLSSNKFRYLSPFKEKEIEKLIKGFIEHNQKKDKILKSVDVTSIKNIKKRQDRNDLSAVKATIIKLKKKGYSNRKIATALNISEFKVRYWIKQ